MSEFNKASVWPDETAQAWLLEQKLSIPPNPNGYIEQLTGRYKGTESAIYLAKVSELVEPKDIVLGTDPYMPYARAFFKGSILGLDVAEEMLGKGYEAEVLGRLPDVSIEASSQDELHRMLEEHAMEVVDMAERGYAQAEAFHELLESIEDDLVPEVTHQPYLKRGFGIVMHQVHESLMDRDMYELEREADAISFAIEQDPGQLDDKLNQLLD